MRDIRLFSDPARQMINVLRNIKAGQLWKKRALDLLESKGYRYMMFSGNFSRKDVVATLESLTEGKELVNERLGWFPRQMLGYLSRLEDASAFLDELESKKDRSMSHAAEKAEKYLPESAEIEADIYLVLGGSDAYGVNLLDTRAVVVNVGSYLSQMNELTAVLAHELHHKAENRSREIYWRLHRNGPKNLKRVYSIVDELIGEGIATLVTFPYYFAYKYSSIREKIDDEYKKVEDGIIESYQDITEERREQIFSSLYNHAGPLYMVGCDMAKKIEDNQGLEDLVRSYQEPLLFFQTYENARHKTVEGYRFSERTLAVIKELQDEIDRILGVTL